MARWRLQPTSYWDERITDAGSIIIVSQERNEGRKEECKEGKRDREKNREGRRKRRKAERNEEKKKKEASS